MSPNILTDNISKFGSWLVKRFIRKEEIKNRHFEKIKKEILEPFLERLKNEKQRYSRINYLVSEKDLLVLENYMSMNSQLLKDVLENHFTEIGNFKLQLDFFKRDFEKEINKLIVKLESDLEVKFYKDSLKRFFLGKKINSSEIKIDGDQVVYGNHLICHSNENSSKIIKKTLESIAKNKSNLTNNSQMINLLRNRLIVSIEKALASENLKKDCEFIR